MTNISNMNNSICLYPADNEEDFYNNALLTLAKDAKDTFDLALTIKTTIDLAYSPLKILPLEELTISKIQTVGFTTFSRVFISKLARVEFNKLADYSCHTYVSDYENICKISLKVAGGAGIGFVTTGAETLLTTANPLVAIASGVNSAIYEGVDAYEKLYGQTTIGKYFVAPVAEIVEHLINTYKDGPKKILKAAIPILGYATMLQTIFEPKSFEEITGIENKNFNPNDIFKFVQNTTDFSLNFIGEQINESIADL